MKIIRKIERIENSIRIINTLIKRYSRVEYRKLALEKTRNKLIESKKKLILEFLHKPNCFLVDLASISVIGVKKCKPRYLRNNEGYYNLPFSLLLKSH